MKLKIHPIRNGKNFKNKNYFSLERDTCECGVCELISTNSSNRVKVIKTGKNTFVILSELMVPTELKKFNLFEYLKAKSLFFNF